MVQETHDAPIGRAIGLLLFGVMAGGILGFAVVVQVLTVFAG